jgi:hypothetical protein
MDYIFAALGILLIGSLAWLALMVNSACDELISLKDRVEALAHDVRELPHALPEPPPPVDLTETDRRMALLLSLTKALYQRQEQRIESAKAIIQERQERREARQGRQLLRSRLKDKAEAARA